VLAGYAVQTIARQRLPRVARPPDTTVVDPEVERRLRTLGYVGDAD
jgi:hypothetical protein